MACCGQLRSAFRLESTPHPSASRPVPTPPPSPASATGSAQDSGPVGPATLLRYTKDTPILVRGPATGRQYRFSPSSPNQAVDLRDAEALLRTGLFTAARGN